MGAPHGHRLHFHGHSPLHRAPAHLKVAGLVTFMLAVVATPGAWVPAFAAYAVALGVLVAISGVPVGYLARRMVVETPVLVFAALLPFVATGPEVDVLGHVRGRQGHLSPARGHHGAGAGDRGDARPRKRLRRLRHHG